MEPGIHHQRFGDIPVAVIDFETTGLNAGRDRVVELAVVRIDPGEKPRVAIESLINPDRPMGATEIHGITDADVSDAPHFDEIAEDLLAVMSGCVVSSYNIYFDIQFLDYELRRLRLPHQFPHFCLMYLRPMLGLGKRCTLADACDCHSIAMNCSHFCGSDAWAAASLWLLYRSEFGKRNLLTFGDLCNLKTYKFMESFAMDPVIVRGASNKSDWKRTKARRTQQPEPLRTVCEPSPTFANANANANAVAMYWDELKMALSDFEITDEELISLAGKAKSWGIERDAIRALHTRVYVNALSFFAQDQVVDDRENERIRQLHRCLRRLGWAPGD